MAGSWTCPLKLMKVSGLPAAPSSAARDPLRAAPPPPWLFPAPAVQLPTSFGRLGAAARAPGGALAAPDAACSVSSPPPPRACAANRPPSLPQKPWLPPADIHMCHAIWSTFLYPLMIDELLWRALTRSLACCCFAVAASFSASRTAAVPRPRSSCKAVSAARSCASTLRISC